jgi:predicted AAA+ superfamily ATPase
MSELFKFKRDITKKIAERLVENTNLIQVITGPRQVGKTTAIKQVLNQLDLPHLYFSADLPAPPDVSWIAQQWEKARLLRQKNRAVVLVLDEIQKIDRWSEEVKRLWEEDGGRQGNTRVVLLGSSAMLIQKGLRESLAGRFEILRCSHWTFEECRACFGWNLNQYVYFGGYPGAAVFIKDEPRWMSYVRDSLIETTLSKDILLMNVVDKPALLRKLFVLSCNYAAQILSYQKMLGQLTDAGNTTTLAHYQKLLESAYLVAGLEKFSSSKVKKRSSSPKWLPLNTALMSALAERSFSETVSDPAAWGRFVEACVGAYLFNQAQIHGMELFYWREGNHEVDYILQKGLKIVAIEVKSVHRKDSLSGLSLFEKLYKPFRSLVVGDGGIKLEEFLLKNPLEWF